MLHTFRYCLCNRDPTWPGFPTPVHSSWSIQSASWFCMQSSLLMIRQGCQIFHRRGSVHKWDLGVTDCVNKIGKCSTRVEIRTLDIKNYSYISNTCYEHITTASSYSNSWWLNQDTYMTMTPATRIEGELPYLSAFQIGNLGIPKLKNLLAHFHEHKFKLCSHRNLAILNTKLSVRTVFQKVVFCEVQ